MDVYYILEREEPGASCHHCGHDLKKDAKRCPRCLSDDPFAKGKTMEIRHVAQPPAGATEQVFHNNEKLFFALRNLFREDAEYAILNNLGPWDKRTAMREAMEAMLHVHPHSVPADFMPKVTPATKPVKPPRLRFPVAQWLAPGKDIMIDDYLDNRQVVITISDVSRDAEQLRELAHTINQIAETLETPAPTDTTVSVEMERHSRWTVAARQVRTNFDEAVKHRTTQIKTPGEWLDAYGKPFNIAQHEWQEFRQWFATQPEFAAWTMPDTGQFRTMYDLYREQYNSYASGTPVSLHLKTLREFIIADPHKEPAIHTAFLAWYDKLIATRPKNCRNAQRDRGGAYPKSGCDHCGIGGLTGCPFESPTTPCKP